VTPRPYQIEGRDFLAARKFALLADEMRVGKTPQAILAAQKIGARSVIVVCPAIAVAHWRAEFDKWWPEFGGRLEVLSYDRLRLGWAGRVGEPKWDVAVIDECHFAKNPEAQRTKLVYGKTGLGWRSDHMWVLSGTPATKHAGELWAMLRAFGVVGMTYDEFLKRYCRIDWNGIVRGTKSAMVPELRELLGKIMLRRTRKQVAPDMPAIDYQFLEVEAAGADLKLPGGLSDAGVAKWCEVHATSDAEDRIAVALSKVQPLVDQIEFSIREQRMAQTVVFGWHIEPLQQVVAELRLRNISAELLNGSTPLSKRTQIQGAFRAGDVQVVVANILAAGTAIDLSSASHGYFLELWWVGSDNLQASNRLVSMDKTEPITFDIVTRPGSSDDRVQRVLVRRMCELRLLLS